jgi:RimJ/RimL family protein N-acetyltransferase
VLVRLGQEVQEVPRRLATPDPPLADRLIRLEPLTQAHATALAALVDDPDVKRFTMVPSDADATFVAGWIERYERGWDDASKAGFAVLLADEVVGFAALVQVDLERGEAEIGYLIGPAARGRGVATSAVELLTRWSFDELGLERLELRIDPANVGSERVAERTGYERDGILRSRYFKEGLRADVGIWSRLRASSPVH